MRVAVIGSGISGLASAFLLKNHFDVHLFEKDGRLGGHSNTVDAQFGDVVVPVDTGFIVYNPLNYPNLVSLFDFLSVPSLRTDMSFSVSLNNGQLEYEGSIKGLLAQPSNFLKRRYWSMLYDLVRFYKTAASQVTDGAVDETLGQFVARHGYGAAFINDHLIPMGAAIWSASISSMMDFPVRTFMSFMKNHKLLNFIDRPQWRTVAGGSREYVKRIEAHLTDRIHLNTNIRQIRRLNGGVMIEIEGKGEIWFDAVVMASHADQSLTLIQDASADERDILSSFHFQQNHAVLHSDAKLMPNRQGAWAAWNYISHSSSPTRLRNDNIKGVGLDLANDLCLTYWMNRLQSIDPAYPLYETLNPTTMPDASLIHGEFYYRHPVFDFRAISAQPRLREIQGKNGLFFAGAWTGYGFHEDGLKSAIAVAKTLGVDIPWPSAVKPYERLPAPTMGTA
ncbi:FAD-dependent oxidoreductase [Candidatus Puniceispirillum sp.]|nr:FAD-dependent oxidoreductase [Candidatus Puniceispirillum sp.]